MLFCTYIVQRTDLGMHWIYQFIGNFTRYRHCFPYSSVRLRAFSTEENIDFLPSSGRSILSPPARLLCARASERPPFAQPDIRSRIARARPSDRPTDRPLLPPSAASVRSVFGERPASTSAPLAHCSSLCPQLFFSACGRARNGEED